ncbi:MAG: Peptidase and in kexin sedolisin [Blastococcus sp.]|nr:Peptidase and in kexin sedolisin [Blastococcus sp.]
MRTRLATALTVAVLSGLTVVSPAQATDEVVLDVLTVVDGDYVVETVTVPATTAEATTDRLEATPEVVAAGPSVTYQVDAGTDPYWDTTDPQATSAVRDAWPRTRGAGQIVAVLDSAVDTSHPDLAGAFVPGTQMITGPGATWHATGVAGTVAARAENGIGSAGMAPEAKIMPVRVCNDSGCPSAGIARGILWAADHGADVINMSLSGAGNSDVTAAAVRYALDKNISVIASAGNDGLTGNWVMYPAALSGVIGVSSTAPDGTPSDWAVHGWQVDMSTVGDRVLLPKPGNTYWEGTGTSFSAPAVAGAVALLRSAVPGITPEQVQAALQAGSASGVDWPRSYGAGRLDVPAALAAADHADGSVAVAPSAGQVSVSWPATPGATSYTVRIDGVVRSEVAGTTATVTGLTDGNQVAVDVQASNGDRSRPVLATVGAAAPGTPALGSASLRGTGTNAILDLQAWVPGVPALQYLVLRDGVSLGSVSSWGLTTTPRTVSLAIGAMPTLETRWQLRGVDALGRSSAASNTVITGTGRPAAPGAVTGLDAQLDDDRVLLTWDDQGSAYSYRVSAGGGVVAEPRTAGAVVASPAPGASLSYAVVAVDRWNQSGPAVTTTVNRTARPVMTVAPAVVGTLVVGSTVSTPDAFTGADSVTHAWRTCDAIGCAPLPGDVTHVITSAEAGKELQVVATARNAGGVTTAAGPRSAVVASNVPVTVPGPAVVRQVTAGARSATVRWSPPADNGGAALLGYTVTAFHSGVAVADASTSAGITSAEIPGLTNGTPYTFTVKASNSAGYGPASAESPAVVPASAPGAPLMGTPVPGDAAVRVAWSPPSTDGGRPITGYTIRTYLGLDLVATSSTTAMERVVSGLLNGTAYTFSVTATNVAGTGLAGTLTATPRTVPGAPGVRAATSRPGAAMVRWAPPAFDGGSTVTGYRVKVYRGATLVRTVDVAGNVTSALVTGLANGAAHVVRVAASNAAGLGPAVITTSTLLPKMIRRPRGLP